ncbi:MAG TPA: hypothetical protein VFD01_03320 [Candidatus Dormibacteraeota bacterium]|nr:hypothetical protein [Candidatus Dormibacteraeota bacterium]
MIALSLLLFLTACATPALEMRVEPSAGRLDAWPGWFLCLFGWLGILVLQFGWYANLFLPPALLLLGLRLWVAALVVSGIGLLLAGDTFLLAITPLPNGDDVGHRLYLNRPLIGCDLWLASMAVVAAAAVVSLVRRSRTTPPAG